MLIILAQNSLGNAALIGLFLIVSGLANTVSGYVWGRLADYSSRSLMAVASGINDVGIVARATRQTVAAIEQSRYSPSLEAAFRIAEVFGVDITTVFFWKAETKGTQSPEFNS